MFPSIKKDTKSLITLQVFKSTYFTIKPYLANEKKISSNYKCIVRFLNNDLNSAILIKDVEVNKKGVVS